MSAASQSTPILPEIAAMEPDIELRKLGRLERILGPEFYRIFRGVITNPLSVVGTSLILFFVLVAILAPQIIPPANANNPYMIPRDGFGTTPLPRHSLASAGTTAAFLVETADRKR